MLANTVEQGNQAVVKDVEKVLERRVFLRLALEDEFRTWNVERAEATRESEEVDAHLGGRFRLRVLGDVLLALDLGDIAGGKIQFHSGAEMDHFLRRIRSLSW